RAARHHVQQPGGTFPLTDRGEVDIHGDVSVPAAAVAPHLWDRFHDRRSTTRDGTGRRTRPSCVTGVSPMRTPSSPRSGSGRSRSPVGGRVRPSWRLDAVLPGGASPHVPVLFEFPTDDADRVAARLFG